MDYKRKCYIEKDKGVVPFVPEMKTELVEIPMKIKKRIYPYKKNLNYDNLLMTNIGVYSRMQRFVAEKIVYEIKKRFDNYEDLVITEANGGVGGLSVYLVQHFKLIKIVDINKLHAKVIINNLNEYNYTNFKVYINDYLNIMMKLKQDVIIFDPPWGGTKYKDHQKMKLSLDNVDISCIIRKLYDANKFKLLLFLIPSNFNVKSFSKLLKLKFYRYNLKKTRFNSNSK